MFVWHNRPKVLKDFLLRTEKGIKWVCAFGLVYKCLQICFCIKFVRQATPQTTFVVERDGAQSH